MTIYWVQMWYVVITLKGDDYQVKRWHNNVLSLLQIGQWTYWIDGVFNE